MRQYTQAQKPAVLVEGEFALGDMIAALRVGHEAVRAVRCPFDRPQDLLRCPGQRGFLGIMIDFRAEAAADVGRDDTQLVLGYRQHERAHQQADDMRVLARGVERVAVFRPVVFGHGGARLHRVRHEPVVDQLQRRDAVRLGEGGIDFVMDQRRAGRGSLRHRHDRG